MSLLLLVLFILFFSIGGVIVYETSKNDDFSKGLSALGIATFLFASSCLFLFGVKVSYKEGQIDALSGKIHYELVEEKAWKEKK